MLLLTRRTPWIIALLVALFVSFGNATQSFAQGAPDVGTPGIVPPEDEKKADPVKEMEEQIAAVADLKPEEEVLGYALNNITLMLCAVLVFLMQAGFAMVESGFNSGKNVVNILFKNSMDICIGVLLFYFIGYGLMYPGEYFEAKTLLPSNGWFGFGGFGLYDHGVKPDQTFEPSVAFLFQAVFAATAATIVSGAVAGRMKVAGYLIYSAVLTAFIYPVSGMWKWGGGWTTQFGIYDRIEDSWSMAFQDFAGSAVVHGVGGFAALAAAIVIGPRIGRFVNGKSNPMPGHNMTIAALGVFILWFGWYGFNPGSELSFTTRGDVQVMMNCAITTTLAAAAGGFIATIASWVMFGKPDLSMGLNGILGGLVGITAGCDAFSPSMSIVVGAIAGILVIAGVMALEMARIDDPVGAFPVHGLCGIWGCVALGFLPNSHLEGGATSFPIQLMCAVAICVWAFVTMFILCFVLKLVGLLRVSAEEEQTGLDLSEHGMHAYTADK